MELELSRTVWMEEGDSPETAIDDRTPSSDTFTSHTFRELHNRLY